MKPVNALVAALLLSLPGCLNAVEDGAGSEGGLSADRLGEVHQGLSDPAARRARSEAIRDVAAGRGLTNGVLLAGIAQVETGLSHCWSEATWACQGPSSPSCGGPVIAGAADGPCSAHQGGLGMFQFDGGTYTDTLARDGEEILLLEGNITHAVDFVAERVRQDIPGVDSISEAIVWLNAVPVVAGDPTFERWIELVSCRYNGCCGCSSQETKYRDATLDALAEFEAGFWDMTADPPSCDAIPATGATLEENDACAVSGGALQYWRVVSSAGHDGRLQWTHTTDSATTENFGQWNLDFEQGGVYRLEVYTDGGTYGESRQAAYTIRHAGQETVVVIDQAAASGFQLLAELEFAAGAGQTVRFDDNTGEPLSTETRLMFDALRVTPVAVDDPEDPADPEDPEDPNDGPGGDPGSDPEAHETDPDAAGGSSVMFGGCSVGGRDAGGGASLLLALLCAVLRRRSGRARG